MKKKMNQKEQILELMRIDGYITTYTAFQELGCVDSRKRISEIRAGVGCDKVDIGTIPCHKKNRFGEKVSFNVYHLEGVYGCPQCKRFQLVEVDPFFHEEHLKCTHCGYRCDHSISRPTAKGEAHRYSKSLEC